MQDIGRYYGLDINHSGMACCPFHDDHNPSMKIYDDGFYCFGCAAYGDCTGFVAKLFSISQIEAAKKISYDFGLGIFERDFAVNVHVKPDPEREFRMWLNKAKKTVDNYLFALLRWERMYEPVNPDEKVNPLFYESVMERGYAEYVSEILNYGRDSEKKKMYEDNKAYFSKIEKRLNETVSTKGSVRRKVI